MAAEQTTYFNAKVSIFKLNDGSSLRDLSPYVVGIDGLPGEVEVGDITTWGSVGERPGMGIYVVHFSVDFLFNMVTSVGVDTILGAMFTAKALRAYEYYPAGATAGNSKYAGSAYLVKYNAPSKSRGNVLAHAEFQGDNGVTLTAPT